MDWSKAKTILIIVFLVLNIFLGGNLWLKSSAKSDITIVSANEIDEAKKILKQEGIIVKADIPKKVSPQPFLTVSYTKINGEKTALSFFGELEEVEIFNDEDNITYQKGDRQLIIMDKGIISYFDNEDSEIIYSDLNKEKAEKIAYEFIEEHVGFPQNAVHDRTVFYDQSDSYLVEYIQLHNGTYISSSCIDVLVTPGGVKSYYCAWIDPLGYSGKPKKIISSVHALFQIVDVFAKNEDDIIVTDIQPGYYSRQYNAEKWHAVPSWRIKTNEGDTYYINGYTGELEQ
ncbi:MAG TPA: hypothetical protein GX526_06980 [Thermoanaerobacterales bacterium]|nr:hypothetical protein [Thermoanaerobacterales bacterium]